MRTLILFDGKRVPSSGTTGEVDINTIPQMLLSRVDVVTGGASAVYGSDAISGVINFIVDNKFEGVKAVAQAGVSSRGDGDSQRLGVAMGRQLGDRAHVIGSYEYYNSDGLPSRLSRPLGRAIYGMQGGGTAANPYRLLSNLRRGTSSFGGYIVDGPLAGQQFLAGGVIGPFIRGAPSGTTGIDIGGDGTFSEGVLLAGLKSHQAFGRFDYDLSDTVKFHVQVAGTTSANSQPFLQPSFSNYTFSTSNPFLTPAQQAALSAGGAATFRINKTFDSIDLTQINSKTENYYATVGLEGSIGDYKWEVAYSRSESRLRVAIPNNINTGRFTAALDAVRAPNGSIVCSVTLTNPTAYPGCVPFNAFGRGVEDPAAVAYVREESRFRQTNTLDDVTASIAGAPFSTWAGPVNMALSAEYRRESSRTVSNAEPTVPPNCTGVRFNCTPTSLPYLSSSVASGSGKQNVTEGALEVDVPLLKDAAFADSLNMNAAIRRTHYSTSGNATTWKVGLDWHLNDDVSSGAPVHGIFVRPTWRTSSPRGRSGRPATSINTPGLVGR